MGIFILAILSKMFIDKMLSNLNTKNKLVYINIYYSQIVPVISIVAKFFLFLLQI